MKVHKRIGCSLGSRLAVLMLALVLDGSTALGQMPGRWVGTTSSGGQLEFQVNPDGTIAPYTSDFSLTCESGGQHPSRLTVFSPPVPIVDQSFDGGAPPRELGGSFAFEFAGTFASDTEAAGTFSFVVPTFLILDDGYTSQLCRDDTEWKAVWMEPAVPLQSFGLRPSAGDQVTAYSDGSFSVQFKKKAVPPTAR